MEQDGGVYLECRAISLTRAVPRGLGWLIEPIIRNLPRDLFAAFRATLEELREADLLLHVIDISNPRFEEQIHAVEKILEELDIATKPTLRVFNKMDRFSDAELLQTLCRRFNAIPVSALDPRTLPPLVTRLESVISRLNPAGAEHPAASIAFQPT